MRIFLLGATGRTGTEILDLALAHGHEVTAFVRSPQKLTPRARLTIVPGDPKDVRALSAAMVGHDAVLSAIGAPPREALRPSTLMTECGTACVAAMRTAHVKRLAIVSAAVLFPEKGLLFAFFRWVLKHHARDLLAMEGAVTSSDLAWTIARPPRLVATKEETYRSATGAMPAGGTVASFRATAAFMLDAVERHAHVNEIVGLAR
jgi:putative NADH-flavin reductase